MKKHVKKLKLAKETVRSLETTDIGKADAGAGTYTCLSYWCATSAGPYVCAQVCAPTGNSCYC